MLESLRTAQLSYEREAAQISVGTLPVAPPTALGYGASIHAAGLSVRQAVSRSDSVYAAASTLATCVHCSV